MRNGIAIGGNIFVDNLKRIDFFPEEGMLSPIRTEEMSVGGCVSNTAISLKCLAPSLDVRAVGCIGNDRAGRFVRDTYNQCGLNTQGLTTLQGVPTGYTDVFATPKTRTFFVNVGANALFDMQYLDLSQLDVRILHLGYLLLLECMDSADKECGTVMARALREAQSLGIKTSIDIVSEDSDRFQRIVPAALQYCNYVIINEIEAGRTVGISPRDADGKLIGKNLLWICSALLEKGVSECVILHFPEAGLWMDTTMRWKCVKSLALPDGYIKGSVGAGDAFCASALYGLYNELEPYEILRLANSAAAGCLSAPDGTSGIGTAKQMLRLNKIYSRQNEQIDDLEEFNRWLL